MIETLKNVQRCIGQVEGIALMSEEMVRDVLMGAAESISDGVEMLQKRVEALEKTDTRRVREPENMPGTGCEFCKTGKPVALWGEHGLLVGLQFCPRCGRKY